ncbi:hypothetical protein CHUAL_009917 [Chamberlinius hualienensis]
MTKIEPIYFIGSPIKNPNNNAVVKIESTTQSCGSIYDIYRPWGCVGKYVGLVQLPGLYEIPVLKRMQNKKKKILMELILPFFILIVQVFASFNITRALVSFCLKSKIGVDLLVLLVAQMHTIAVGPTVTLFYFFIFSKKIVNYLKVHRSIEVLLKQRKPHLIHFALVMFIIAMSAIASRYGLWALKLRNHIRFFNIDIEHWYSPRIFPIVLIINGFGLALMAIAECQVHFAYVMFQHTVKVAFDELIKQIELNKHQSMDPAVTLAKLKSYRHLHQQLCVVAKLLDDLFSPMIASHYILYTICTFGASFFLTSQFNGRVDRNWEAIVISMMLSVIQLSLLSLIAAVSGATTRMGRKVLPAVFSSFNLDSKEAKDEVRLFAYQVKCQKIFFSASGLFKINVPILLKIFGAIASYIVIMVQLRSMTS